MKFQRTLSQPNVLLLKAYPPKPSVAQQAWQYLMDWISLGAIWTSFVNYASGVVEPTIRKRDHHGQTQYRIYDPSSEQRSAWLSEAEARAWLEQRYYQ